MLKEGVHNDGLSERVMVKEVFHHDFTYFNCIIT